MLQKNTLLIVIISLVSLANCQISFLPAKELLEKQENLKTIHVSSTTKTPLPLEDLLSSVGLNTSQLFKISNWKNMCTIRLREQSSFTGLFRAIERSDSCKATLNDAIVETRIVLNGGQWQCSWSSSSYAAGTNLSFYQMIESKYNDALNLVIGGDQYLINLINQMKNEHLLLIQTNKNTAKMSASCRTIPTKSGFNCDLTLQARIKYLH